MNERWDNVMEEAPASFEARMLSALDALEERPKIRRFRMPAGLVAAVLAVALLGGTALATDFFGLGSLTVSDPYATPDAGASVIALQGVPESREFLANAEWMDYLSRYRAEGGAMDGGLTMQGYELYSVFNGDMADRLEHIITKYDLELHTSVTDFYSEQELCALSGVESFITGCTAISGYVYEDGSFQGDGTNVSDGRFWEYQFGRYKKGSFSEVTLNVGDTASYTEWIYATSSGVTVQLSLGRDRSILLADLSDSFIAVNLLGGTEGNAVFMPEALTQADLEAFAEQFDFTKVS